MKRAFPWIIFGLFALWIAGRLWPARSQPGFDVDGFGRLPVLVGGRVMPMDSVARTSLLAIRTRQTYETAEGKKAPARRWLLAVMTMPQQADELKVFRVDDPELLNAIGWQGRTEHYFSFTEFRPILGDIERQANAAAQVDAQIRTPFQRNIVKLRSALLLYLQLKNSLQLEDSPDFSREIQLFERAINPGLQAVRDRDAGRQFNNTDFENILQFTKRYQNFAQAKYVNAIPDPAGKDDNERWKHMGEALLASIGSGQLSLPTQIYGRLISTYRAGDVTGFNQVIQEYNRYLGTAMPGMLSRPAVEFRFNQVEPFYLAMVLYVAVFLFAVFSWLVWPRTLGKTAALLTVLAFTVHTAGLLVRMYLQGRPPVTNLYSSALFVGWAAVLLCLIFERFYKNGIGSMCASVIGFSTLLIAHNLQLDGDTMEMLRAVLDTNFWLATHVIMVTMGYSAQFLAGLLGIIYIFRGVFTSFFDPGIQKSLSRMMYGVVCFGALFSLVGTILGGIWADQSWGRFWGWDPKENGALLIVLWNAIILHARWGGFAKGRGIATMCVFGNIVTSLSWFGTNMLGVGLHSYGFMDRAFGVLSAFILSQFIIMGIGLLPERYWRGLRRREEGEREAAVDRELPELSGARKT